MFYSYVRIGSAFGLLGTDVAACLYEAKGYATMRYARHLGAEYEQLFC